MSKAILISIRPEWCELIALGAKTIEIRKTKPKIETPFKCYIYESSGNQRVGNENFNVYLKGKGRKKVIGEFVCDRIHRIAIIDDECVDVVDCNTACLSSREILDYANGNLLYGWHISDLVIYDEPRELSYFCKPVECHRGLQKEECVGCWDCEIKRPPQSWCYVEESDNV